MSNYHLPEFWDERYKTDRDPFEWYQRFAELKPKIQDLFPENARVLVVGSGSSEFSFNLWDDADIKIKEIKAIDVSDIVVSRMKEQVGDRSGVEYTTMDCCELGFSDGDFDVVFEKASMDSLLCGENAADRVNQTLDHIHRVLKPGGVFISVSYANRDMRSLYYERESLGWDVEVRQIPKPKLLDAPAAADEFHFIYICKKVQ
eukprot:gnl/Dysnectes_brevis/713_a786_5606.p1 GENE.gnl/Dysnectes_brevis/713_a786_5606~~gnl/Dysnectes_brevis/713_a786_5606.p1  ORF type:complete len:216 (+),score=42.65 gnl/Dysnectes_brevis/713_a786_5606:40-648(+)